MTKCSRYAQQFIITQAGSFTVIWYLENLDPCNQSLYKGPTATRVWWCHSENRPCVLSWYNLWHHLLFYSTWNFSPLHWFMRSAKSLAPYPAFLSLSTSLLLSPICPLSLPIPCIEWCPLVNLKTEHAIFIWCLWYLSFLKVYFVCQTLKTVFCFVYLVVIYLYWAYR